MRIRADVLVVVGYVLLGSAWVVGNPPGSSPDEAAHYVKALAAGRGELYLQTRPPPPADLDELSIPLRWHQVTSRLVRVPGHLDPTGLLCSAAAPEVTAGCLRNHAPYPPGDVERLTIVGPYQPFTYVLPGMLMRLGDDPESATRWGRAGFALFSAAFVALAALVLWSPEDPAYSLVGLLVAVTPAVLFTATSLSANGVEIAAGLCWMAAIMRMTREGPVSGRVWLAAGLAGAVLPLARVTGLVWIVLGALVLVALVGIRPAVEIVRQGGRRAIVALTAVVLGAATSLAWEVVVQPHPERSLGAAIRTIPGELQELPAIFEQALGVFGWLDTRMSTVGYLLWKALLVGLIALALLVGRRRRRMVLLGLIVSSVLVTVGIAVLNRPTGFGVQARYVLAFLVVVPLAAGEMVLTGAHRRALRPRWLPVAIAGVVAVAQAGAWYFNARRYAVGSTGPRLFLGQAEWAPPGGWVPWMVVVGLGAGMLVLASLSRRRGDQVPEPP